MADIKITDLEEISTVAQNDVVPIVDIDDTSQDSTGSTKKVPISTLSAAITGGSSFPSGAIVGDTDAQTLTNKTIDGDVNTLQDIPFSAIKGVTKTGTQNTLVSGTKGGNGDLGQWNSAGDLVGKTIISLLGTIYPVGCVYTSTVGTNPNTLFGFGTWVAFGAGKVLVGINSGDADFDTAEETGGAKTKTIAQENLPNISTGAGTAHTHTQNAHGHRMRYDNISASGTAIDNGNSTGTQWKAANTWIENSTATNQNESAHTHSLGGSGTALDVMNPYIVVYFFKRTE